MASNRVNRRKKKKRATTLDPTSASFRESARFALSVSPSPKDDKKKLKSKTKASRMAKSKSPSGYKSKKLSLKPSKENKIEKNGKRRSESTTISPPSLKLGANSMGPPIVNGKKNKTKKSKKFKSQTPGTDYVGLSMDSDDPFGVKKKNKMIPKTSLSTTIPSIFSSDDELNGDDRGCNMRSKSARFSSKNKTMTFSDDKKEDSPSFSKKYKKMKLTNSKTINEGSKNLESSSKAVKTQINGGFDDFHKALNEQQSKLFDDLETIYDAKKKELFDDLESIYDAKKKELVDIEQKLFQNAKKSKNAKSKEYEFDPNIKLILNKPKILQQIEKFGRVQGTDSDRFQNDAINPISMHLNQNSVIIHDEMDDDEIDEDDDDEELSTAAKQKLILGEIQQKTMSKLDTVILMEKEAKKKAKQAADLTKEVEEGLKNIAQRTKVINEKLAESRPELDKARAAVNGIDPIDINEIKTLKSPPIVIENVITATVMILGHKVKEWNDAKKLLSYKFKPELLNFDTYTLTKATRQKVYKKYAGKEDFCYDRVYEGSKACGNLVLWVLSQIKYSRVLDIIIPLEKEVKIEER